MPVALVTGASAGLGVEFTRQLSKRGYRLVLAARRKDRLDALAAELGNARAVGIDLGAAGAVDRLMGDIADHGETVEVLINNAGFGIVGPVARTDPGRLRQLVDLNVAALTELSRAVLPAMLERNSGAIVNVASTAAFQPCPGFAAYGASKAYVLSFTEALHEELRGTAIKVSALCPGPTRTEFGEVAGFDNKLGAALDKLSMDAASVVRMGLDSLDRNRAIRVTGAINKVGAAATRFLPRSLLRRIAGAAKL
jgi:short-subunit dehydrogenase